MTIVVAESDKERRQGAPQMKCTTTLRVFDAVDDKANQQPGNSRATWHVSMERDKHWLRRVPGNRRTCLS